jgi:hypothetical protein
VELEFLGKVLLEVLEQVLLHTPQVVVVGLGLLE